MKKSHWRSRVTKNSRRHGGRRTRVSKKSVKKSRGGRSKKSRGGRSKKSRCGRSKKSRCGRSKKSRRQMRGGCWLTDMFSSKQNENVVQRALNNHNKIQQGLQSQKEELQQRLQQQSQLRLNFQQKLKNSAAAHKRFDETKQKHSRKKMANDFFKKIPVNEQYELRSQRNEELNKWLRGEGEEIDKIALEEVLPLVNFPSNSFK
jgi:transcriptional accessory protein Tex/SPT6